LELDLRPRLIFSGNELDLVTFEIRSAEFDRLDRRTVQWPPSIPRVGQSVIMAGFPGVGKRLTGPSTATFGLFHALTGVDSVNEGDISMVRPPDDEVVDVAGKGLPPRAFDMGGMSGGPVFAVLENAGIVSWFLAGVIYECHINLEITKAVRADRIDENGMVNG
jgi:hypothetical protein